MAGQILVRNRRSGRTLASAADVANTSEKRRQGLLMHTALSEGEGLWIVPCEGVHTFGMQFMIDVVYLNRHRRVVKVRRALARSRISFCLRAHSVLELPAGAAQDTEVGDELEIERLSRSDTP